MKLGEKTQFNVQGYVQSNSHEQLFHKAEYDMGSTREILFRFLNLEIRCNKL